MKHIIALVVCVWLATTIASAQSKDERSNTVAYLQALQNTDGGFRFQTGPGPSSVSATSAAIRALKYFGGQAKEPAACRKYLSSCFDKTSGGFCDQVGTAASTTATALGLVSTVDLEMPTVTISDAACKYLLKNAKTFEEIRIAAAGLESVHVIPKSPNTWLQDVYKMRNPNETFGKDDGIARDTGSAVVVILRLGGKVDNKENVVNAMRSGQRSDGGFGKMAAEGSDLETSYRVMRAFMMLNETPDREPMRNFIGLCRNSDGGYSFSPGQPSNVAASYFAGIILHWLEAWTSGPG